MKRNLKVILILISVTFLQTTSLSSNEQIVESGISYDEIYDPIEPINRAVLNFNFFIDDIAIRPIVKTYKFIAPEPVEKGVSNFFSNLKEPIRTVSFILQGEFYKSFNSIGRFTINTITSLGTFDLASKVGMEKNETDLGITLAKGGVSSGPYIVIPIIGPSNLRDFSGDVIEYFVDPLSNNVPNREYIAIGNGLNERVEIDEQIDKVRDVSSDRYEMIKSIYYQNRNAQLEEEYIQNLPVPKIYIE
jgi:phospholipid-binding lipoprotein MlaA